MTVLISDLLPDAMPYVAGCNQAQLEKALLSSAIRFCEQTMIWTATDTISVSDSIEVYDLYPEYESDIIGITSVTQGGRPVHPLNEDHQDRIQTGWREHASQYAEGYSMPSSRLIRPYPMVNSDAADDLVVKAKLKPSRDALSLPDDLVLDYREGIVAGALWKLMQIPDERWSSERLSMINKHDHYTAMGQAKAKVVKGNTNASQRVNYQKFGG